MHVRRPVLLVTAAVGALVLAGCGSSTPHTAAGHTAGASATAGAATGSHNAQDVAFATDMVPHHAQAVEMADMVLSREADPRLTALARQIKAAQGPEIDQLSAWLRSWGAPAPSTGSGHSGHGMAGTHGADGMMSDQEMTDLDRATGARFAQLFLAGMTRHHQGAVAMARTEVASGQDAEAVALARRIIAAQEAEILQMRTLLEQLVR